MYIFINILLVLIVFLIIFLSDKVGKKNTIKGIEKYYKYVFFVFLFMIGFTSIYKLGVVPKGFHIDEAGMFYDAYSIATCGVDRYLNKYPVYFINFGSGMNAMYIYLAALLIKLFGAKLIFMRTPGIIIRIIAFIFAYYLIRLEKNKTLRIVFLFLLTVCPYFIMQSRWGLESNLLVGFLTIAISLFINYLYNRKLLLLFLSGVVLGLSLYCYAVSYIMIPVFLLITIIYLLLIKKINIKEIIVLGIPIFIIGLPLILMVLVNSGFIPEIRTFITITKLPTYRVGELSLLNIFSNFRIIFNVLTFDNFLKGENLVYNSLPEFGTLYYISIPFFILGLSISVNNFIKDWKDKNVNVNTIILIWFVSVISCLLIIKLPNINKANALFIPLIYFVSTGIISIVKNNKTILLSLLVVYLINYGLFLNLYYNEYNIKYDRPLGFMTYEIDAIDYADSLDFKTIYVDYNVFEFIYLQAYKLESPYKDTDNIIIVDGTKYIYTPLDELPDNAAYVTKSIKNIEYNHIKKFNDVYVVYK